MKVIYVPAELDAGIRPVCIAIGVFDGVHLGHQKVLQQTLADAKACSGAAVAVTFDRHPSEIVAPKFAPPLLYPVSKKLRVFDQMGMAAACIIRFDKEFSQLAGPVFVHNLAEGFRRLQSIAVGDNFQFGRGRSGNVTMLQKLGQELDFVVHGVPEVDLDGRPVSSTRIRDAVREGDFAAASQMLGRSYTLSGPVITGQQLGRKLGFPTANIDISGLLTPPRGVYAATARVSTGTYRAAVNIGYRPTIASATPQLHVEAHILEFSGDIVGQDLELEFLQKIRPEKKFASLDELRQQIASDIALISTLKSEPTGR